MGKTAKDASRIRIDGLEAIARRAGMSEKTLRRRRRSGGAPWGVIRVTETNRYWAWADEIDRAMERASARAR